MLAHALAVDLSLAVRAEVGDFDVGVAGLFLGFVGEAALLAEPVGGQVLLGRVVVHGVVRLRFRFVLAAGFRHAVFPQDRLVGVLGGNAAHFGYEIYIISAFATGKAGILPGFQVNAEAGLAVVVKGAEAG